MAGESINQLQIGHEAPGFELTGADNDTHRLRDFLDHAAVLVVFTCNHCPYAKAKIPLLNEIASEYDEVAVVGINPNDAEQYPDDSFERMQELSRDGTIQYDAYLHDPTQETAKAYGAVCTPDPYLLARSNDRFTLAYHGRLDDALNPDDTPTTIDVKRAIESVLQGDPIPDEFKPSRGCTIKWKPGNEPEYA